MIGRFITELPMDDPSEIRVSSKPMLRRFVNYDKPIYYIKELGSGAHGAVYLAIIDGKEYAIKVVSFIPDYCCPCYSYAINLV